LAAYPAVVGNDVHLLRIRCGGCAAEWAGEDWAHCAGCHVSFDSIILFDVHREGGGCVRPQVLGLVATKNGIGGDQASTRRRVAGRSPTDGALRLAHRSTVAVAVSTAVAGAWTAVLPRQLPYLP
jgi:hypothetical protein